MAAQALALHIAEETHQAEPSQDAGQRRLRMIWFLQGIGLAAIMLIGGVAAVGCFASGSEKPSGHAAAFAFLPAMPRSNTGGKQTPASSSAMRGEPPLAMIRPIGDQFSQPEQASGKLLGSFSPQIVQGGSLRTWSYRAPNVEQVQVVLSSEGRPIYADIELWHGLASTPFEMRVYSEYGVMRRFSAVVEFPNGLNTVSRNTVSIRNIGQIDRELSADVVHDQALATSTIVQSGAPRTFPRGSDEVLSVEVLPTTEGRPLYVRIELLQGTNDNNEQVFFAILETPGSGNVIRIVNNAAVELPMRASVVPHSINNHMDQIGFLLG